MAVRLTRLVDAAANALAHDSQIRASSHRGARARHASRDLSSAGMRGFLAWCGALTVGFGAAGLVVSVAFNVLDAILPVDWTGTCGEILCNSLIAVLILTFAVWLVLGAWLTARARRWIESRLGVSRRRARLW
jgi:hypothetical protein